MKVQLSLSKVLVIKDSDIRAAVTVLNQTTYNQEVIVRCGCNLISISKGILTQS